MESLTLRFASHWPYNPTSPIIAVLGGSTHFSHVMTIVDDMAYEATMLNGCRVAPLDVAMKGVASYQDMIVPVENVQLAIHWGMRQAGKGYDFAGAIGIPFLMSDDWADSSKWWCSEHALMMVLAGGTKMIDINFAKRVTPQHLLMCTYEKAAVVNLKSGK